jgi:hypothetical protein
MLLVFTAWPDTEVRFDATNFATVTGAAGSAAAAAGAAPAGAAAGAAGAAGADQPVAVIELLRGDRPDGTFVSGDRLDLATFSDAADQPLPRAPRWSSLLINDVLNGIDASGGSAGADASAGASTGTGSEDGSEYYMGDHQPEQSIMSALQTAAAAAAEVEGGGGGGGGGAWNMTSGGEWRLVIRNKSSGGSGGGGGGSSGDGGGAGGGGGGDGGGGAFGKLVYWSIRLCGTPEDV